MAIYVWTGIGAGKTTSSLGVALRTVAHGKKAVIVQFMKGRKDTGEFLIKDKLGPLYEIFQFGSEEFVDLKNPSEDDKKKAEEALAFAEKKMLEEKPFLLVLDEVNIAMSFGLIKTEDVLKLIKKCPEGVNLYLTGRFCPREVMEAADYVTEFVSLKKPEKMVATEGIEY
ncbi:cob(I)yrinic acid a,c-diamide adenosyltransferase [Candidatus Woesearchaeota archaeon]|nr:MAG: cob(I)yrinic acid a,c-diamide adenosyltransferase [Candidatus Woesearchaeota archaeon ex4484_78]RLE47023.1 MAG: cob(I)yrinic acid a,c-diamide adenosyltransferase [Candidatus Woesearchaeota archaeon]